MRRIMLAALALVASTVASIGLAPAAQEVGESEFRKAVIQMDPGRRELMQDIETLIACLSTWSPGKGKGDNAVSIAHTGPDRYTLSVTLRSPTNMYFEMTREYDAPVAILRRVEYLFPERNAFQQITDAETKREVLHSACPRL